MTQSPTTAEASRTAPDAFTLVSVRRRLLRGSFWVFAGKIVTIPLGFVMSAVLARLLTPTELGAYFATFTLVLVGSVVAQLGLDRAAVRFVSAALGTGERGKARDVIHTVFIVGVPSAIVTGLVLILGLGNWLASHVFHSPVMEAVIPVAAGWLVVTAVRALVVETFRGFQQFGLATVFDSLLADFLTALALGALLITRVRPSLTQVVSLSVAFGTVAAVMAGVLLLRRLRVLRGSDGRVSKREIFSMAWPALITDVAIYVLGTGIDLLVLGAFRPLGEVAVYGAASRLMMLAVTPYRILQGVTPPIISELYAQGRKRELEQALRAAATLAGIPAALVLALFIVAGSSVLGHVFGPFYRQGATILAILTVGRLVAVWTGSCGLALMMTGHQKAMMYITVFSGIVSITAGILVAPRFGGVGVAVATATTASMQNLLQLFLAKRLVGVSTQAELSPRTLFRFFSGRSSS
jgi:O-antigen/teichoic acid export membrane protein